MTLSEIVEQLRSCGYVCEAGSLELNVAFIELVRMAESDRREVLAAYSHEAWAAWMKWMFERGGAMAEVVTNGEQMECWVMSPSSFRRWQRQMNTPYADLPESEKASDRAEADKILAIVEG